MDFKKIVKPKHTHRERVEMIKNHAGKNKIFTIFAVVAVMFLLGNFLFSKVNPPQTPPENAPAQTETVQNAPEEKEPWRFYWLDVWILAIGGGFCFVMIIRERRKARHDI